MVQPEDDEPKQLPKTVAEAVQRLVETLSDRSKKRIAESSEDDLVMFHMGLGTGIRNDFGLWEGNKELLKSCGSEDMSADDASSVIIKQLWMRLKDELGSDLWRQNATEEKTKLGQEIGREMLLGAKLGILYQVRTLLELPISEGGTVLQRLTATDEDGNTPLHLAALNGHAEVVAWLWMTMKREAPNLELCNKAGKTPLDLAREQGHAAVIRILDRRST